jgi:starch-binding outer membrane protein, SusD/RagB family
VILTYAEALIENNQVAQGVAQINKVRARPSTHLPPLNITDQNLARKALRHERRIELNMEGLRLADLMRWTRDDGQSGTVPGTTPGSYLEQIFGSGLNGKHILMRLGDDVQLKDQNLSFPKNLLFPIPQPELDINKKCVQNPGW